jgi:hypothetical protein
MLQMPAAPLELRAYVAGEVVEVLAREGVVVETEGAFVQGIFGLGGEAAGAIEIVAPARDATVGAEALNDTHRGKVLVCGAGVGAAAFNRAIEVGAAAVVAGGFDYAGVKELLGRDLGVAITGTEVLGCTLVVTEGFGRIPMAPGTFDLLRAHAGRPASVNGATQIRAGVIRPEVIIPSVERTGARAADAPGTGLDVGSRVRGIRYPYFGRIGVVAALPAEPRTVTSEARVRVLEVRFDDGEAAVLPRANVEAIEA